MCSGPVLRKMIVFTLPIMFSGLFQLLFNATDIIVVGRFAGDNALAAVGSNTALINLMTNLFIGISIGANVVAARKTTLSLTGQSTRQCCSALSADSC